MTYDPDALRQMNDEAQMRIAELSTALGLVTDQRDTLEDSLNAAIRECDSYKHYVERLTSTVERLTSYIAQRNEPSESLFKAQQKVDDLLRSYQERFEL